MTGQNQFIAKGGPEMTLADPRFSHRDHIDRLLQKRTWLEPFNLELQGGGKPLEVKGPKCFLQRQATVAQESFCPSFLAQRFLLFGELMQIGFMTESFFGGAQREVREVFCHPGEFETVEDGFEILMAIDGVRHRPSLLME